MSSSPETDDVEAIVAARMKEREAKCQRCGGKGTVNGHEWLGTGYEQLRCLEFPHSRACEDSTRIEVLREKLSSRAEEISRLGAELEMRTGELMPLRRAADRLAARVNEMVDCGVLGSRSLAADALLDYATERYGGADPIGCVRNVSANLAAASLNEAKKDSPERIDMAAEPPTHCASCNRPLMRSFSDSGVWVYWTCINLACAKYHHHQHQLPAALVYPQSASEPLPATARTEFPTCKRCGVNMDLGEASVFTCCEACSASPLQSAVSTET